MTYERLRSECLARGRLFEDGDFPAADDSLHKGRPAAVGVRWARPGDICGEPRFIVEGTSRFDLDQGDLGNCWFVAAAATVAMKPQLLEKILPAKQDFQSGYAGIFRFRFWRYGRWEEVVVDDRLPVKWGQLIYAKNRSQPNEFWYALLEKAYAKLHGSYEALKGGKVQDGMVDMTGGAGEVFPLHLSHRLPRKLFSFMQELDNMNSLMGCCIPADRSRELANGLVVGHAYSITGLLKLHVEGGKKQRLLRLRNPWGRKEWNGAWSDRSKEWHQFSEAERATLGLLPRDDGEFWMSYEDWRHHFKELQICHLTPDSPRLDERLKEWHMGSMDGHWVPGVTAGGCGDPDEDLYWQNPQCHVVLSSPTGAGAACTLIVSLMHKFRRLLAVEGKGRDIIIDYDLYKVMDHIPQKPGAKLYTASQLALQNRMALDLNQREVCRSFLLEPATYCIIPATREPNQHADFFLRVVTEAHVTVIGLDEPELSAPGVDHGNLDLFNKWADDGMGADARALRKLIKALYRGELTLAMADCQALIRDINGEDATFIDFGEFCSLQEKLDKYQEYFREVDEDNNGVITLRQFRRLLRMAGVGKLRRALQDAIRADFGQDGDHYSPGEACVIASRLASVRARYEEMHGHLGPDGSSQLDKHLLDAIAQL